MSYVEVARATRDPIVILGGAFMTASELDVEEKRLGMSHRFLYFRGRSAVLSDPPADVVTSLFGIFPGWLVELVIEQVTPMVSADTAIDGYSRACAAWGRRVVGGLDAAGIADAAALLFRIVDGADVTALPLAAGWHGQDRPEAPAERLAFALMLARELRGGLHFAALRTCGLTVPEAVVVDPGGGRGRLERTGWLAEDADALVARVQQFPDSDTRWQAAERFTDEAFAAAFSALDEAETDRLVRLLARTYDAAIAQTPAPA